MASNYRIYTCVALMKSTAESEGSISTVLLARHAQSLQNQAKKQLFYWLGSPEGGSLSESQKNSHPQYRSIKYDPQFLDAGLSDLGLEQALGTGKNIKDKWQHKIGGIVVSPLKRALQTTQKILEVLGESGKNIQVWVEPLLSEILQASCDIGSDITNSLKKYGKRFNFDALSEEDWASWSVRIMEDKQLQQSILSQVNEENNVHKLALQAMVQNNGLQKVDEAKNRTKKLKLKIQQYIGRLSPEPVGSKSNKILIVGHYSILRYLTCSKYKDATAGEEVGYPHNGIELWNAEVVEINDDFLDHNF